MDCPNLLPPQYAASFAPQHHAAAFNYPFLPTDTRTQIRDFPMTHFRENQTFVALHCLFAATSSLFRKSYE